MLFSTKYKWIQIKLISLLLTLYHDVEQAVSPTDMITAPEGSRRQKIFFSHLDTSVALANQAFARTPDETAVVESYNEPGPASVHSDTAFAACDTVSVFESVAEAYCEQAYSMVAPVPAFDLETVAPAAIAAVDTTKAQSAEVELVSVVARSLGYS